MLGSMKSIPPTAIAACITTPASARTATRLPEIERKPSVALCSIDESCTKHDQDKANKPVLLNEQDDTYQCDANTE
jgi:hypothetical protein